MNTKEKPIVSVIIPTFNSEKFIKNTVLSVLEQTYKNCEILIVDDGSTDHTKEVIEPFDNELRYFYQKNSGESAARNMGLEKSSGDFIVFLDSDDLLYPDMVEEAVSKLALNMDYHVVFGGIIPFFGDILPENIRSQKMILKQSKDHLKDVIQGQVLIPGQFLLRKEVFGHIKPFRTDMKFGEDFEFCLRLAREYKFLHLNKYFLKKRIHENMQTLSNEKPDIVELRLNIIRGVFGDESDQIIKKYLGKPVLANWHRSYGFDLSLKGDKKNAEKCLVKSLRLHPFQVKLWAWLGYNKLPNFLKNRIKRMKLRA